MTSKDFRLCNSKRNSRVVGLAIFEPEMICIEIWILYSQSGWKWSTFYGYKGNCSYLCSSLPVYLTKIDNYNAVPIPIFGPWLLDSMVLNLVESFLKSRWGRQSKIWLWCFFNFGQAHFATIGREANYGIK